MNLNKTIVLVVSIITFFPFLIMVLDATDGEYEKSLLSRLLEK